MRNISVASRNLSFKEIGDCVDKILDEQEKRMFLKEKIIIK